MGDWTFDLFHRFRWLSRGVGNVLVGEGTQMNSITRRILALTLGGIAAAGWTSLAESQQFSQRPPLQPITQTASCKFDWSGIPNDFSLKIPEDAIPTSPALVGGYLTWPSPPTFPTTYHINTYTSSYSANMISATSSYQSTWQNINNYWVGSWSPTSINTASGTNVRMSLIIPFNAVNGSYLKMTSEVKDNSGNMYCTGSVTWTIGPGQDLAKVVQGTGWDAQDGGIAFGDFNNNGVPDVVLMEVDAPLGQNTFRYTIGWDVNSKGNAQSWSVFPAVGGARGSTRRWHRNRRYQWEWCSGHYLHDDRSSWQCRQFV